MGKHILDGYSRRSVVRDMIKPIILAILMVGVLFTPTQASAQTAQDICLSRWVWNDEGDDAFWSPPFYSNHLGTLDMRSTPERGAAGGTGGWGFFTYDMTPSGEQCMGGDLDAIMTGPDVGTLAIVLGVDGRDIEARTMRDLLIELHMEEGDPTGQTRWKPFQTTRRGLIVHLGGYGQIHGERFNETSQATQNTLDVRVADYRRFVSEGVPISQLRAQTGFDGFRIFGREPTPADLDRLLPPERREDGYTCPDIERCTVIVESFDTADSDTLGPNLTWTELGSTDVDILTNRAHATTANGFARAESDLAGADMYAQANVFNLILGTFRGGSGCVRYSAAADTAYYVRSNADGIGNFNAYDVIARSAGVDSVLTTFSGFTDLSGGVVRVEILGSDIEVFYDGATRGTTSDGSITGNTRAGICGRQTGVDRLEWDNFEAADVGAFARRVIRIN
jgi:hypothetical protein